MTPQDSFSTIDLQLLLAKAKAKSDRFVTNFFVSPALWPKWLEQGLRPLLVSERVLLLSWPEPKCLRLYFAGDLHSLARTLAPSTLASEKPIAVDLIGRRPAIQLLSAEFTKANFRSHVRLNRLSLGRAVGLSKRTTTPEMSSAAKLDDIPELLQLLDDNFDPYADQLPDHRMMKESIELGELHVDRSRGKLDGFLWSVSQGATGHIRFWCVAAAARGRGVGSRLMNDYFFRNQECSRHLLWVRENNPVATACYQHYGYKPDDLEDQVMLFGKHI
jgi:ribosomal protein S18 acetylase RimI-like enzyme